MAGRPDGAEASDQDSDSDIADGRVLERLENACFVRCRKALSRCLPAMGAGHEVCVLLVSGNHASPDGGRPPRRRLLDQKFNVLRGVLEEWSPVMTASMRWPSSSESGDKIIHINDFSLTATSYFVSFLYGDLKKFNDECICTPELLWDIARMGKFYGVPECTELCISHLNYRAHYQSQNERLLPSLEVLSSYGFDLEELCNMGCTRALLCQLEITLPQFLELHFTEHTGPAHIAKLVLPQGRLSLRQITSEMISRKREDFSGRAGAAGATPAPHGAL